MRTTLRCYFCNWFLKSEPDYVECEQGVDEEYEFGTYGDVIRTGWQTTINYRICKCGYENKEEV